MEGVVKKGLPKIRVDFNLLGDDFDLGIVSKEMGMEPTSTRRKEDCPVAITAVTCWRVSTKDSECKAVSWKMKEIIKLLEGKEGVVRGLCERYRMQTSFTVVVEMENGNGPELVLDEETISFLSRIQAEVGFDLYID